MGEQWNSIPLASQSYIPRSEYGHMERLVNLYPEATPSGFSLYQDPGLKLWTSVGDGPIRGVGWAENEIWVVSGDELYVIDESKIATRVPGSVAGTSAVRIITDGTNAAVITSTNAYYATKTTLSLLPESSLNMATIQDGYGIYSQLGTQFFWLSDLDDLSTIGATAFSSADAEPSLIKGVISDHRELVVAKERSTEFWFNAGTSPFPFQRDPSGFIEIGCSASGSLAKALNSVFLLGDDYQVYEIQGRQPKPIATAGILRIINEQTGRGSAEAFTYKDKQTGHVHYCLTFSNATIAYDLTTQKWRERKSDGLNRWRVSCHTDAFGKNLFGDYENGNIYELDVDTYDENGAEMRRELILPILDANGNHMYVDEFELDMEAGVGLTSGQGSDPQMMLDISRDGGATYGNERWRNIGDKGKRRKRVRWSRLGRFQHGNIRCAISDPVKTVIHGARIRSGVSA